MIQNNGKILIVDDDAEVLLAAELVLKRRFATVVTACTPASIELLLSQHAFDVILLDMNFTAGATSGDEGIHWLKTSQRLAPDAKVVLMTAYGGVDEAVRAMREGATDFVVKPWDNARLVATVSAAAQLARADSEIRQLRGRARTLNELGAASDYIVGDGMRQVLADIEKVARTDANVLITGENGTGKELVARAIHQRSLRHAAPFVGVDLGAISESLFESELFGHKKGAFTDAREDRAGRFEAAAGGTLFLDEIGNLSLPMQAKLLGALATMTVTRVGTDKPVSVDARVLCATNLTAEQLRDPERFRPDLLYRINTIEIHIPPLRERPADIALLVAHFARHYARKYGRAELAIPAEVMARPAAVPLARQCARAEACGGTCRDHERERQLPAGRHRAGAGRARAARGRGHGHTESRRAGKAGHPAGHQPLPGQPDARGAGTGAGSHHAVSQDGPPWARIISVSTSSCGCCCWPPACASRYGAGR